MHTEALLKTQIYFSYNQFMVFDEDIPLPGCAWTKAHSEQGFCRRESVVCFGTLLDFGLANLTIFRGPFCARQEHERAISVPFQVTSGNVLVEGPEENGNGCLIRIPQAHYRLTAAQWLVDEETQSIDLFFEPLADPLQASAILIADADLYPPALLIETADIAGGE